MANTHDLVVLGGGPGGSTLASFVAMKGHRVLLLEEAKFPRHQIGESLLPATIHGICAMLGLSQEIAEAGFPRKRGGTFRWGKSPEPWTFAFTKNPADPFGFAYQVERDRFDEMLLRNAGRVLTRGQLIDRVWGSDYVGDGKTLLSLLICHCALRNGRKPLLSIPSHVFQQLWNTDIRFARMKSIFDSPVLTIAKKTRKERYYTVTSGKRAIYITTHSLLSQPDCHEWLNMLAPDCIVIDEAHNFANARAARTRRLTQAIKRVLIVFQASRTDGVFHHQHLELAGWRGRAKRALLPFAHGIHRFLGNAAMATGGLPGRKDAGLDPGLHRRAALVFHLTRLPARRQCRSRYATCRRTASARPTGRAKLRSAPGQ